MEKLIVVDDNEPKLKVANKESSLRLDIDALKEKSSELFNNIYTMADKVGGTLPDIVTPIKRFLSPKKY
jgi:hypothetical protein